jgi:ribosomal protein L4
LSNLVGEGTTLVVLPEKDQAHASIVRALDNLTDAKVLLVRYLNIRDLFSYDKVLLPVKSLDALAATLG